MRICDSSGNTIGSVESSGNIYINGQRIGMYNGSTGHILDTNGNTVGYINNGNILDRFGNRIGWIQ
jgi:hypothetical protein